MQRDQSTGRDLVVYLPLVVVLMIVLVFIGVFAMDAVSGKLAAAAPRPRPGSLDGHAPAAARHRS